MEPTLDEYLAEVDRWKEAASKKRARRQSRGPVDDTTPEARRVMVEVFRRMPTADKWRRLQQLYRAGRVLHEAGFKQRSPNATAQEVVNDWMELTIDPNVLHEMRESANGSAG